MTELEVGVWTDITPAGARTEGFWDIGIDPSNPAVLYVSSDGDGIWKSEDSGKSWRKLGNPRGSREETKTSYLDDTSRIEVDPNDSNHIYVTEGVEGEHLGFWVSHDGGETFEMPAGFVEIIDQVGFDYTAMSVSPTDFDRLIISSHSPWDIAGDASGILSSADGGLSWKIHTPPRGAAWSPGTKGVFILEDPKTGQGNKDTWLVTDEGGGFWRTEDAGETWKKVSEAASPHGGNFFQYTKEGVLYAGGYPEPWRSEDNGKTWKRVPNLPSSMFFMVAVADDMLFTHVYDPSPYYYTSPADDGTTWKENRDYGKVRGAPFEMRFDPVNHVLYSTNWGEPGVFALRLK